MSKRTSIAASLVLAVAAAVIFFAVNRESEFVYQGRPVSSWALELCGPERPDREEAARVLRAIGSQAVPSLIRMAGARDPFYKRVVLALAPKLPARAQVFWHRILKPLESQRRRLAAVLALQLLDARAAPAVPVLSRALAGDDPQVAWQAGVALSQIGGPGVTALIAALDPRKPFLASRVCDILSTLGPRASNAVPAMIDALAAQSPLLPEHATKALAAIGPMTVPAVTEALTHRQARVRQRAAEILGAMGPTSVAAVTRLIGRLRDGDASVRGAAADALGRIRAWDPRVIHALIPMLNDPDGAVRLAALKALKRAPTDLAASAEATLRLLLDDQNIEARGIAASLLEELQRAEHSGTKPQP